MCVVLGTSTPVQDLFLAQKILIERDEQRFIDTANIFTSRSFREVLDSYFTESLWNLYPFKASTSLITDSAGRSIPASWQNLQKVSKREAFFTHSSLSLSPAVTARDFLDTAF
jgi:hypothetical protein